MTNVHMNLNLNHSLFAVNNGFFLGHFISLFYYYIIQKSLLASFFYMK